MWDPAIPGVCGTSLTKKNRLTAKSEVQLVVALTNLQHLFGHSCFLGARCTAMFRLARHEKLDTAEAC